MRHIWDRRWEGAGERDRVTFLGRRMFMAKERAITKAIGGLQIKTVLEVGCGLGYTLQVFRDAGLDCIGIDISPRAVDACKKKDLNVRLVGLEDVKEGYDLVSSDGLLEHLLNFAPSAEQMMRLSRKFVLLIQPNHGSLFGRTAVYLSELIRGDKNVFEYNYRISDFIAVFCGKGFRLIRNTPIFFDIFRLLLFERE